MPELDCLASNFYHAITSYHPGAFLTLFPSKSTTSNIQVAELASLSSQSHSGCSNQMSSLGSTSISSERHKFQLSGTLGGSPATVECAALRYPCSHRGITLILTHGVSGHKEEYHPVVVRLLKLRESAEYEIREIWSIDFPNHGEAATLNRTTLEQRKAKGVREGYDGACTAAVDWATYLNAFMSLPRFRDHKLVGLAHSGSCTAWVNALSTFADSSNHARPHGLILLEPTLMFPNMSPEDPRSVHGAANVRGALAKRNRWSSRTDVHRWIAKNGKSIWSRWDKRVLDLYVEYAFEDIVTPEGSYTTPRLRKDEESRHYACLSHTIQPSQLGAVCASLNENGKRGVHIIWGEFEEFISKKAKAEILDAAEHRVTTQRTVIGSGHLVPQLKPDGLADAIHEVLRVIEKCMRASL